MFVTIVIELLCKRLFSMGCVFLGTHIVVRVLLAVWQLAWPPIRWPQGHKSVGLNGFLVAHLHNHTVPSILEGRIV